MTDKQYIRADIEKLTVRCPCGKNFYKKSPAQIVYFCSKQCRVNYRKGK